MNEIELKKYYVANLSGGKDSLYMLGIILNNPIKYPLDACVHFDIGINNPIENDVWEYMKNKLEKIGVKCYTIKPTKNYDNLKNKYGIPHRVSRWCNQLKKDCSKQLEDWLLKQNCVVVHYLGICADEINRIKDKVYPLVEENITEDIILKWAKNQVIFRGWYNYFNRLGCIWCPCATYKEWAYYKYLEPIKYEIIMNEIFDFEQKTGSGYFQTNPKYNAHYVYNRINDHYYPKLLLEMEEIC